jgi:electron transport complex protein RnfC
VVKPGEKVKKGQLIGEPVGFVSSAVHSSLSGRVAEVKDFDHPLGGKKLAVVIEADGEGDFSSPIEPVEDYQAVSAQKLRETIQLAGIVGLGGATFPTHVKLTPPPDKPIDTVILNGAECEPYLTADHRLMLEKPDEIILGLKIILKILNVNRAYIGIENNKEDAVEVMERATRDEKGIEVVSLKVKYPQGAEKQLIKTILGREVPVGGLPFEVGVVVQNVATALAIKEAILDGKPLIERVLTLSGNGVEGGGNFQVPIGTLFKEVIARGGGVKGEIGKLIMGGPMMGIAQYTEDVPVIKGCSGILLIPKEEVEIQEEYPCVSCGRCVKVCPMNLLPSFIARYVEVGEIELAQQYGLADCIECGCCAYICPARKKIVHLVKYGKLKIKK